MANYNSINGTVVDIEGTAGGFMADLWGLKSSDQEVRRNSLSHLSTVAGEGFNYDLKTIDGCENFLADVFDGTLDGHQGASDGSVVLAEGHLLVNGGAGSYKLADPRDYARMRQDGADGKIDGQVGGGQLTARAALAEPSAAAVEAGPAAKAAPAAGAEGGATAGAGPATGGATPSAAVAEVNSMSAPQLIEMMKNGTLPEAIMSDPAAMLALQQKVQEYQRAMQMITEMLKMQHEMLMNIIRNLK